MRKKVLKLEDVEVELYGLKYGKIKEVVLDASKLFSKVLEMTEKGDDELTKLVGPFIQDNLGDVESILFKLTNLNSETVQEVYIDEFLTIFKELLAFNNIKVQQILNFFPKNRMLKGDQNQ
jgi:predicted nucleic acid-binding protein